MSLLLKVSFFHEHRGGDEETSEAEIRIISFYVLKYGIEEQIKAFALEVFETYMVMC